MTRGIRNNNPGNIRLSASHWKGQVKGKDREFCTFASMMYGVRALICLLRTYRYKYGLWTVEKIISRFAPSSENATDIYIMKVCDNLHCFPDDVLYLDWFDYSTQSKLYILCLSICFVESQFNLSHELFIESLVSSDKVISDDYRIYKKLLSTLKSNKDVLPSTSH